MDTVPLRRMQQTAGEGQVRCTTSTVPHGGVVDMQRLQNPGRPDPVAPVLPCTRPSAATLLLPVPPAPAPLLLPACPQSQWLSHPHPKKCACHQPVCCPSSVAMAAAQPGPGQALPPLGPAPREPPAPPLRLLLLLLLLLSWPPAFPQHTSTPPATAPSV